MTRTLFVCDYPCGKGVFRQCVPGINSHIQPFGAAKTIIKKTLLSFIARLLAGLPGIITLKNSVSTQPVYKVSSFHFFCKLNFYRVVSIFLSFFKVLKEIFPLGEKKLSFSSVTGKLLRFLNDR